MLNTHLSSMKRLAPWVFTLAALALSPATRAEEEPLFHLGFDETLAATLAAGPPAPRSGKPAPILQGEGKSGGGLDLRATEFADGYTTLVYTLADNLSLDEGTLEFWYRPEFTRPSSAEAPFTSYYLLDLPTGETKENGGMVRVGLMLSENLGQQKLWLETGLLENEGRGMIPVVVNWNPGEWHHLLLTWNREELTLYLDGVPVATTLSRGGLFAGNEERRALLKGVIGIGGIYGFSGAYSAGGVMDEVRIFARASDDEAAQKAFSRYR